MRGGVWGFFSAVSVASVPNPNPCAGLKSCQPARVLAGRGTVNSRSGRSLARPEKDWLRLAGTRTQPCRLSVACLPGGFWAGRFSGSSFCRLSVSSLPDAFRAGRCSRLKIICGTPPRRRPCPPAKSQHDMSRSAPLANLRTTRGGLFLYGFLLLLLLLLVCSLLLLLLLPIPVLVLVGSGRRRRRRRVPSW